jgi:uncharacterized membrane protein YhaH (DUF805 family)
MENVQNTNQKSKKSGKGNISRNKYLWMIGIFTFIGVTGGYIYYATIGCNNGCAIQSNPYLSMLWGGSLGYLLPGIFFSPKPGNEATAQE